VIAALDADGTDGPTEAAGGLVDGRSISRGVEQGKDAAAALRNHDSLNYLQASGDLLVTGPTGTNVNDLMMALVSR
jgi:glycerate 2-kinase